MMNSIALLIIVVSSIASTSYVFAAKKVKQVTEQKLIIYVASDFDGNLFEDRWKKNGAMPGRRVLFRLKDRPSMMVKHQLLPDSVIVTNVDLERIKNDLALDAETPGAVNLEVTLEDGSKILPGRYYLRDPDSYLNFRPSMRGENVLLDDFKEGEKRVKKESKVMQGPFWDYMIHMLANEETAKRFLLVTMRWHTKREWLEFFQYLQTKKYIKNLPDMDNIFCLGDPKYDYLGKTPVEKKAKLLELIAIDINNKPPGPDKQVLVYADDNQEMIKAAEVLLKNLVLSHNAPRVAIFNSGHDTEVKTTQKPQFYELLNNGTYGNFDIMSCEINLGKLGGRSR
ncbi:MAG: hypothetical protein SGI74_05430 [Oligoflexia bacterium]|nr:hypothetical protein [Oligoflexia bacterium]